MAGGGHGFHAVQPSPSHYHIVWRWYIDHQEVSLHGDASDLDFEGYSALRVFGLRAETHQRGAGCLEILIFETHLLEAIIVEDLRRAPGIHQYSLNQEVL